MKSSAKLLTGVVVLGVIAALFAPSKKEETPAPAPAPTTLKGLPKRKRKKRSARKKSTVIQCRTTKQ
jgi:hypothetical protein